MYDDFCCTLDRWISILRVSTLYELPQVRERAIREINAERHEVELDPVRKIEVAQENKVPEWLARAYEALCQRERGLDDEEAQRLGVVTTNRLWAAREAVRRLNGSHNLYGYSAPNPNVWKEQRYSPSSVTHTVSEIFWPPEPLPPPPTREPDSPQLELWDPLPTLRGVPGKMKKTKGKMRVAACDLPRPSP
jgi:hypothetical protein